METLLLILLGAGLLLVCLSGDWKLALYYTVFVGFVQDPLRKITPGQPQYLVGLVVVSAAFTMLALYFSKRRVPFKSAFLLDSALLQYSPIFFWLLLIGCLSSFLRTGAIEVPLLGIIVYLAPLLSIWLGFHFATHPGTVAKFLMLYVFCVCVYAFTVLLSFWGVASPLFREVGKGLVIYLDIGVGIQGHTGLWRTAEVAAWHLGAASCFSITLGVRTRKVIYILMSALLSLFMLYVAVLTGRRKVFTLVAGFLIVFSILIFLNARKLTRNTFFTALGVLAISASIYALSGGLSELQSGVYGAFFRRGTTVFGDVNSRFTATSTDSLFSVFNVAGLFGLGVGMSYLGIVKYLNVSVSPDIAKVWIEGGFAKMIFEIGIVGFFLLGVMVFLLIRLYLRIAKTPAVVDSPDHLLILGLIAFLAANVPTFSAAGQVFNDFFVLLTIGLSCGFILGLASLDQLISSRSVLPRSLSDISLPAP
ncbi:MAG: hypothetical protein ACK5N0_04710 [Synechococcaceae cyanobacterium]